MKASMRYPATQTDAALADMTNENAASASGNRGGVLLLHGISRSPRSMCALEAAAQMAGYKTANPAYASRSQPLSCIADELAPVVSRFVEELTGPLHVVTHSMGGLVLRVLLSRHPQASLGRIVMLAPPNQGSEVADLLGNNLFYKFWFGPAGQQLMTSRGGRAIHLPATTGFEVGIIAGSRSIYPIASLLLPRPNDGRVSVSSTKLDGMTDHLPIPTSHPFITNNSAAIVQTLNFLRDGRFER